jgi:hypothetical protein
MQRALPSVQSSCVSPQIANLNRQTQPMHIVKLSVAIGLFALTACFLTIPRAFGQIQSTISCPSGQNDWDVLSVMMMDPGLAAGYHMEGYTNGLPSAYIYTQWDPDQNKVYYTKNPQGNPWDINLYDSNYVYQWVTELQEWNGVNHWNDPTSCKKFNNGSQSSTADYSMRWAPRCATPGGANSGMWNAPPPGQPNNTNYYTYVDEVLQSNPQNLDYSYLKVARTGTMDITDNRANPPKTFSITTLPLHYFYSCSVEGKTRSCKSLEVFDYGLDTTVNPVDNVKHSYGWVRWRYYTNTTGGNPDLPATWELSNSSITDQLVAGQVNVNFQCFQ